MKKRLRFFCQFCQHCLFHCRDLVPRHLLIAFFGLECGLYKTVELETKGNYSVAVNVTTTDTAVKVKKICKTKSCIATNLF